MISFQLNISLFQGEREFLKKKEKYVEDKAIRHLEKIWEEDEGLVKREMKRVGKQQTLRLLRHPCSLIFAKVIFIVMLLNI